MSARKSLKPGQIDRTDSGSAILLIRAGHVLTADEPDHILDGAVAIAGSTIAGVGPFAELRQLYPSADVFGSARGILLPGLVNCHGHFSEALIPALGSEATLIEWIDRFIKPVAPYLTREMAFAGTVLKGAEMVLSGVTTVNDMFVSAPRARTPVTPGVVDGLEALGIRGEVSFGAQDEGGLATLSDIFAEHEALAEAASGSRRCRFRLGIATVSGPTDGLLLSSAKAAQSAAWPIHTHFHEVREEVTACRVRHGVTPIRRAAQAGLLDGEVIAAHCIWLSSDDTDLLARHDVKVAHNPVSNMILGSGVCPVRRLAGAGVVVGLGTDGAASNDSQDMLETMKVTGLLQKVHSLDATLLKASEIVWMATLGGARALGLDQRIGSLTVGKDADLVLLSDQTVSLATTHDPFEAVVYAAGPRDVVDVWVEGERIVAGGHVVTVDVDAAVDTARRLSRHLVAKAGLAS